MKASEVLKRYAEGKRNFRGENLRGQYFKGKDLSGADFSEADIRSANFTSANLRGTKLCGAKAGLQKRWVAFMLVMSILTSSLSCLCSILINCFVFLLFDRQVPEHSYLGFLSLIFIVIFLIFTFRKGIVTGIMAVIFAGALTGVGVGAISVAVPSGIDGVVAVTGAFVIAFAVNGAGALALSFAVAGALAVGGGITVAGVGAIGGAIMYPFAVRVANDFAFTQAFASPGEGSEPVPLSLAIDVALAVVDGNLFIAFAIPFAVAFALFGLYIGRRVLKGDEPDGLVRSFAVILAATGGTNFQRADLTDANFTDATLKNTDFRNATLTATCFQQAKKLDLARPGTTYLKSLKIQKWLIGKGKDKNFDGQYLRGVNLQGANLTDATFIDSNLSEANLQNADLSRAKLVQTQLDETDFTGATLTGACIEDWGITTHTKLNGVRCEYVFMRLPTKEDPNPHRKPDNWEENFEGDDFADFIKPIFDTLDLYHNQGVDPRAIAISWKQLAENNPDAHLRFASMEVKGEDNLLLRLKTEPNADLSQLSADYFNTYNQIKALAEAESKKLLAEKDDRIRSLESFVKTALRQSTRTININQGNYNEEIEGDYHEA